MPRLAKVVNVLAKRQVKQGTETTGLRIGFTLFLSYLVLFSGLGSLTNLWERSHMTSARFWQISPCQKLSALTDPPDDVSICQTRPFQRTPYTVH